MLAKALRSPKYSQKKEDTGETGVEVSLLAEQHLGRAVEMACSAASNTPSWKGLPGYGIIDTACTKTCLGKVQLKEWLRLRHAWLKKHKETFKRLGGDFLKLLSTPVTFKESKTMYKCGAGGMKRACSIASIPIIVDAELTQLEVEVVPGSLDLLLSRRTCSRLGLILDLRNTKAWVRGKSIRLVEHRAGHLMLNVLDLWGDGKLTPQAKSKCSGDGNIAQAIFGPRS